MGCSSVATTAHQLYGPSGHQFSVAFPSPPKSDSNAPVLAGLPGVSKAYAYAVSSDPDIFGGGELPEPRPPSFLVGVIVTRSPSNAIDIVHDQSHDSGVKTIVEQGMSGYEYVGSENSTVNQGSPVSDPRAWIGGLFLRRGAAVFVVAVVTAHLAGAKAFLASFRAV
jgi:hypothetical protein